MQSFTDKKILLKCNKLSMNKITGLLFILGFAIVIFIYLKFIRPHNIEKFDVSDLNKHLTTEAPTKLISVENMPIVLFPRPTLTIVQEKNIQLYFNAFNIQTTDPRNSVTISYCFDSPNINDLRSLELTGIEAIIANILNLESPSVVIANGIIYDTNNYPIVSFSVTYPSLAQANAALTSIDNIIQLPDNIAKISNVLNGITFFKMVGNPVQGKAISLNNTYMCSPNSWCDYYNHTIQYNLEGASIPQIINSMDGLSLMNINIHGPPSDSLTTSAANYMLDSFTIAFYMRINSLHFTNGNSIILYQMYAETPNMIRFSFYQKDSDSMNTVVEAILGNKNTIYTWTIPNTTLMSNGNITMYSFVYDKLNGTLNFYIGTTVNTTSLNMNPDEPIILSLSNISINKGSQSLDANLFAFIYYNKILTSAELIKLSDYFNYEYEGISNLTQTNQIISQKIATLTTELNAVTIPSSTPAIASASSCKLEAKSSFNVGINPWIVDYRDKSDFNSDYELNTCSPNN